MLYGDSTSGLRDLSAANRHKIDAVLAGESDGITVPSARFDEDATGTREVGPMNRDLGYENAAKIAAELASGGADDAASERYDEDSTGTRSLGPIGRFDEDATGTRTSGPVG